MHDNFTARQSNTETRDEVSALHSVYTCIHLIGSIEMAAAN